MGIVPRFTENQLKGVVFGSFESIQEKIVETLEFVGEGFVKEARTMNKSEGGFGDVTGNLRSSIGYFILYNGEVIKKSTELAKYGTDKQTGLDTVNEWVKGMQTIQGYQLFGVAGMDYASDVESKGYNVISVQSDAAIIELNELLKELK